VLLPLWTLFLVVGVGAALAGPPALGAALGAIGLLAALWLARRRRLVLAVAAALLATGAALGVIATRPKSLEGVLGRVVAAGLPVAVQARWVRSLRYEASPDLPARALLEIESVAGQDASGRLALSIGAGGDETITFRSGDRVRLRARLNQPRGLANPGQPDAALAARAQGIDVIGFVRRGGDVVLLEPGAWWSPRRLAAQAHVRLAAAIDRAVEPDRAAFLRAIVLGERSAGGPEVEAGFKAAGAVHALSVSGLHLTAVAALAFLLFRRGLLLLPALALRVRTEAVAAVLALGLVLFYTLVTGEAVATQRSALMAALALGAVILRRFPSLANAISFAALVMLASGPLLLLDASFQLSFASVIALALTAGAWEGDPLPTGKAPRASRWVTRGLLVSLAAFLATAPLCAHHFAELSPAAPLGNLLIVPIVELGIVPLGLAGSALGAAWEPLGWAPLQLASLLAAATLWLAERFRQWAPVWPVWSPDALETTLATVAALLVLAARARWYSARVRRWLATGAALLASAAAVSLGARAIDRRLDDGLSVTFLDVGQGDAALVEGPRGQVMLIDGGGAVDGRSRFDPGARVIEPVLRRKTIGQIDVVVLSHPHPDHLNGLLRVLERFPVKALWISGDDGNNPRFSRLLELAARRGTTVGRPRSGALGGLQIQALHPFVGTEIAAPPGLGVNDASLVLRIGFAGRSVLFTGDIEEQGEAELVGGSNLTGGLTSDLLKVPHHASRTSSSDDLLAAVGPSLAVASLAAGNRHGFPHPEVLARYQGRGLPLLRTDLSGAVSWRVAPDGALHVTCERACR
jgi:competence protein ComEC